jgi:hypothetical protein
MRLFLRFPRFTPAVTTIFSVWWFALAFVFGNAAYAQTQTTRDPLMRTGIADSAKSFDPTPQQRTAPNPETYGTASRTYIALSAWNFVPIDSNATYGFRLSPFGIYSITSSATKAYHAGLQMPAGAIVDYFELDLCDTTATGHINAYILKTDTAGTFTTLASWQVTTDAETPGCGPRSLTSFTPFTVDNASYVYNLEVGLTESGIGLELIGARVGYKLQISPDPSTATFADVPVGHPFHRFVEALVAAGITGGCGGGNYCPDAPVTRGQMAVFLSAALGLHWAP